MVKSVKYAEGRKGTANAIRRLRLSLHGLADGRQSNLRTIAERYESFVIGFVCGKNATAFTLTGT
jgi:hypothetical protein